MLATAIVPRIYFRYQLSNQTKSVNNIKEWQIKFQESIVDGNLIDDETEIKPVRFNFDPNLSTYDELISLGFTSKEVKQIIAFRNAGGKFKTKSDLAKIYSINHTSLAELRDFIDLPESESIKNIKAKSENIVVEIIKMDINSASAEELQKIKGVGKVISERTIKYRDALGGFYDFNQLKEVYFLNDSLIPQFEKLFFIDTAQLKKISLTEESFEQLKKHPYLNINQARAIINFSSVNGIATEKDLQKIKILPDSTIRKLSYYIKF